MKRVYIGIYNNIYDITNYLSKHPGEGIRFVSLREYNRKDATDDFERTHFTNEADDILKNAREENMDEESGIHYICPFFFKNKKIPKYFYYSPSDPYGIEYLNKNDDIQFILRRSNSDINSALSLSYKSNKKIHHLKIKLINLEWYVNLENNEGDQIDCVKNNIEDLIEEIKKYLI